MLTILFKIILFVAFIVMLLIVILGGVIIIQAECLEAFNADPFIRIKEYMMVKFAPKVFDKNFFGDDGCFYISIPNYMIDKAAKMSKVKTSLFKNKNEDESREV